MDESVRRPQYNLTLSRSEEARLEQTFASHSNEEGELQLHQFMNLCLEKDVVKNNCSFADLLKVFQQACDDSGTLSRARFYFAVNLLARQLFPQEITPLDKMLTLLLVEPEIAVRAYDDEVTRALLTPQVIQEFADCEAGLSKVIVIYSQENIKARRKVIGWKEAARKNVGISARNLLHFLRLESLVPNSLNAEAFCELLAAAVAPRTPDEHAFFKNAVLVKDYENTRDLQLLTPNPLRPGEPLLRLHEIQLILGRIAMETIQDVPYPDVRVKLLNERLKLGAGMGEGPGLRVEYADESDSDASFSSIDEPQLVMAEYEKKQLVGQPKQTTDLSSAVTNPPAVPSMENVAKFLDSEFLPRLSEPYEVVQENPPPYKLPVIELEMPRPPTPPNKRKPPAPAKANTASRKKEESAADRLKFIPPPDAFMSSEPKRHHVDELHSLSKTLVKSFNPQTALQSLSNPGVKPCLIREILLPPESPPTVSALIESSYVYQNSNNYVMALTTLDKAKNEWLDIEHSYELKPELELFFELSKASIYESCGKDELALGQLMLAHNFSKKLQTGHPDRALVYCALGSVLSHLEQPELSGRCYLKAKELRERTIGGDTVDSATVYNNLGVCMHDLGRLQESFAYFQLSEAILHTLLGPHHPRSLTTSRNIAKMRKTASLPVPEFRTAWKIEMIDPCPKPMKKGKGKGKGKGKKGKKGK
jgi:hypothetical protein